MCKRKAVQARGKYALEFKTGAVWLVRGGQSVPFVQCRFAAQQQEKKSA